MSSNSVLESKNIEEESTESNSNIEDKFNVITEGKASILFPKSNEVFYNPVQEFNRDLSIAVIRTWSEILREEREEKAKKQSQRQTQLTGESSNVGTTNAAASKVESKFSYTILEALAASGLRSIRYAKELPNLKYVVANDLDLEAVNSIKRSVQYNGLSDDLVRTSQGDASDIMYQHRNPLNQFDAIDIDPYGTAAPFLDAAVQSVKDGGLLCVTCTDAAVLCGSNYPEKCYANYGAIPVKGDFCHEMALRILLHTLATSASRYRRYIHPLITLSIDFYIRVFVRVFSSPIQVKTIPCKTSLLYVCSGCHIFYLHPLAKKTEKGTFAPMTGPPVNSLCHFCGNKFHTGGPMWGYILHDKEFVRRILEHVKESNTENYKTHPRMLGMLTVVSEEIDSPFYYILSSLAATVHSTNPSLKQFCSAILNKGYKFSASHAAAGSLKTDAPPEVIWDIVRSWVKLHPVNYNNIAANAPGRKILGNPPSFEADFTFHKDADPPSRKIKLMRFQMNPQKNWGPKARASSKRAKTNDEDDHHQETTDKTPPTKKIVKETRD
ncbi:11033_t:CDS:10 [Ambispora leptoticha]|uniref:tRNA (guanine(26)-N(2))-dimethyltransferase n=1 Tax=Ambispora leptoticha TaxID=144679 RepID=A0A9N8ZGH8_9GLOM|nr:11033_t:CDS:10 [Ambispora leptoticha]